MKFERVLYKKKCPINEPIEMDVQCESKKPQRLFSASRELSENHHH
jgi:hypothetical protein